MPMSILPALIVFEWDQQAWIRSRNRHPWWREWVCRCCALDSFVGLLLGSGAERVLRQFWRERGGGGGCRHYKTAQIVTNNQIIAVDGLLGLKLLLTRHIMNSSRCGSFAGATD